MDFHEWVSLLLVSKWVAFIQNKMKFAFAVALALALAFKFSQCE